MTDQSLFWRTDWTEDDSLKLRKAYKFAGRFRLLERLGQGGFGQVWRVRDLDLDQEVALKISVSDLTAETLVLRRLPKDRYVSIFDYVKDTSVEASAYSMELLERPWMTLDDYQREQIWPKFQNCDNSIDAIKMAIFIGIDLLVTLGELHGKKHGKINRWCHADIKPQNLYVNRKLAKLAWETEWGRLIRPFIKIGDLGLACQAGSFICAGTPGYMAPEQEGSGRVSPATDLFAVAQTIASTIIGRPFDREELKHVARMKTTLAEWMPSAYIVDKITVGLRKMTNATPALRGTSEDSIRFLTSILLSQEDWQVLTVLVSQAPAGITLNDAAEILFIEFAPSKGWRNCTIDRLSELKSMVRSMYKRGILSRNGHKYVVR